MDSCAQGHRIKGRRTGEIAWGGRHWPERVVAADEASASPDSGILVRATALAGDTFTHRRTSPETWRTGSR
jgi:hypothetical protein